MSQRKKSVSRGISLDADNDTSSNNKFTNFVPVLNDANPEEIVLNGGSITQLISMEKVLGHVKKARKMLLKFGLKRVYDVRRITVNNSNGVLYFSNNPEVYKNSLGDTYIIFGEPEIESVNQQDQMASAEHFKVPNSNNVPETPFIEVHEEEEVDASGIDEKDIELVVNQASSTREEAIKPLRNNDLDIVNAIMEFAKL